MSLNRIKTYYINFTAKNKVERDIGDLGTIITTINYTIGIFNTNSDCYETDTRQNMNIHMYQVNLTKYGNGVYHMAVRIYNGLPNKLNIISDNPNKFKASLK
jgi:hypothetical protein